MNSSQDGLTRLLRGIRNQAPYASLEDTEFETLFSSCSLLRFEAGQLMLRPDELPQHIFLVVKGNLRLLGRDIGSKESVTLDKRGSGQLVGWVSLLRGAPCEWVIASEATIAAALPAKEFVKCIQINEKFAEAFSILSSVQESYFVAAAASHQNVYQLSEHNNNLIEKATKSLVRTLPPDVPFSSTELQLSQYNWFLSTDGVPGYSVGTLIKEGQTLPSYNAFTFPYRLIGFDKLDTSYSLSECLQESEDIFADPEDIPGASLLQLGILDGDLLEDNDNYPVVKGKGLLKSVLAVCEMAALYQNVPFRRDIISKVLEDHSRRKRVISLEFVARLCEVLGLTCQVARIESQHLQSIEAPALFMLDEYPVILYAIRGNLVTLGHPERGIIRMDLSQLINSVNSDFQFALPRRARTTPTSRFGWNWFMPLIRKYKKSLILVFVASLLSQLFGLAIPLLIQQIIDKVLNQGNLSSLNVLGTTMIVLALFQGVLLALRTYIFVDTTDRMDLTLGSGVIDRLLALPLTFYEKRPVGELSQRLGELNNIRSFLTGTALMTVLNIIFATLYLVVMIIYSPLLSAVALSTLPIYVLLVVGLAPIYKSLKRKQAIAQARTQSHLIEVIGGIQTVKAQHFELTARWKWQDRYREFVNQGFRSVALATSSGVAGQFLNQLSGLLVLWVGMWLVLKGELTLGMLIAFRIISGNVTGPLLQLSSLYQGFQTVQISMERLSDIVDQNPELSREDDLNQIALPAIKGDIRFENVSFRFGAKGPYQVNDVSLAIDHGQFVGIVGQSGSGKSTLMKLLPRLYEPENGRIFIDDYDISKVNLSSLRRQIGIVPQDSLLFEGTIAENIALNDPEADDESIIRAAKIACAHEFIMALGQGYATKIAERGSNLSGGQRQRIAIARTILSNPQLLVMDEATSALDYNTERTLCLNLQEWADGRTVLFITHRLSTIKNSDIILVMNDGCLVEKGSHEQLMENGQRYCALYKQQGE